MLAPQGRGTKSDILFLIRASNSECMVNYQLWLEKVSLGFLGISEMAGSDMGTERVKGFLGLPIMLQTVMVLGGDTGRTGDDGRKGDLGTLLSGKMGDAKWFLAGEDGSK